MSGISAPPRLIAITDRGRADAAETLARFQVLSRAARPSSVVLQLRDPELPAAERLRFGRELGALARATGQLFQVNDRLDLAVLLGAHGVHLGEAGVETAEARRVVGGGAFVTRAWHDAESVVQVEADGVLLSPVLDARKGRGPLGLRSLEQAREKLAASGKETLLFALGGIDAARARECLDAGAHGVAVIGAVLDRNASLEALVRALGCER